MNDRARPPVRPERLAALHEALRDRTPADRAVLDALAAQVADALGSPVALISLVLDDAQLFVGAHGLDGWLARTRGTPVEWSFCAHVVDSGAPLDVPDPANTPPFSGNPLVTEGIVGSYQGVPVRSPSGEVLGSLCVISEKARALEADGWKQLEAAAAEAARLLAPRRRAEP